MIIIVLVPNYYDNNNVMILLGLKTVCNECMRIKDSGIEKLRRDIKPQTVEKSNTT